MHQIQINFMFFDACFMFLLTFSFVFHVFVVRGNPICFIFAAPFHFFVVRRNLIYFLNSNSVSGPTFIEPPVEFWNQFSKKCEAWLENKKSGSRRKHEWHWKAEEEVHSSEEATIFEHIRCLLLSVMHVVLYKSYMQKIITWMCRAEHPWTPLAGDPMVGTNGS